MRYFIRLRFNGEGYHGWQIQLTGISVQEVVNEALSRALRQPIQTIGCGRTDTGVHAEDFYAHFDVIEPIENPKEVLNKLASQRIRGVQFREIFPVKDDASARFDARLRTYEYRITTEQNPFLEGLSYYIFSPLDIERMQTAANLLIGKQDFKTFTKSRTQVKHTICTISQAEWIWDDGLLIFRIRANRFLRNMVRAITGTLLDIGKGKRKSESILDLIEEKKRADAGISVPACGLFLTEIEYKPGIRFEE
jgi:tRNA pseudouridine38-40 synthase